MIGISIKRAAFSMSLALHLVMACATSRGQVPSRVAFEDRFDGALKPQWSAIRPLISTTPAGGHKFLGPFGGESVLLNLADLPDHRFVRLSMDVLIMRSWDGNTPERGPDILYVYSDDGRVLYATSFSWYTPQAYPGLFGIHTAPMGTGVKVQNSFGFMHLGEPRDGLFHIECVFPHREAKLGFRLLSTTQSAITDEAWGILNARVTLEEPAPTNANALADAWEQLASNDPAASTQALWKLVEAGDAAVPVLAGKLRGATLPADVELLDPTQAATRRLVPAAKDGFSMDDPVQRQVVLGAHALQVIGTPAAREVRRGLATQEPLNMKTVKVTVRDIASRQPIPFIPVWVWTYGSALHASVVTDSQGQATVHVPAEIGGQLYFLNARAGYVPIGKVMPAQSLPPTLDLPVERSVVIGGTVVDESQKPVPNAAMFFNIRKEFPEPSLVTRLDGLNVVTDSQGRWELDLGPAQPEAMRIGARDPQVATKDPPTMVDFMPRLAELRQGTAKVVIPKPTVLRVKVVDADTGRPLAKFRVSIAPVTNGQIGPLQSTRGEGLAGVFDLPIAPGYEAVVVHIDAEGYLTTKSEPIPRSAMSAEHQLKLFTTR